MIVKDDQEDCNNYEVEWVCKNGAYKLLENYFMFRDGLDWSKYNSLQKVYIDFYLYNGKVCADLSSVDIDKILNLDI